MRIRLNYHYTYSLLDPSLLYYSLSKGIDEAERSVSRAYVGAGTAVHAHARRWLDLAESVIEGKVHRIEVDSSALVDGKSEINHGSNNYV